MKIFVFLAKCDNNFDKYEVREILEYLKLHAKRANEITSQEFLDKLFDYNPTEEDYFDGINSINKLSKNRVESFSKSLLKLLMVDGFMHKKEKEYLAEYIQTLRELNIYVKFGFN